MGWGLIRGHFDPSRIHEIPVASVFRCFSWLSPIIGLRFASGARTSCLIKPKQTCTDAR